jgi:hypothetical protein
VEARIPTSPIPLLEREHPLDPALPGRRRKVKNLAALDRGERCGYGCGPFNSTTLDDYLVRDAAPMSHITTRHCHVSPEDDEDPISSHTCNGNYFLERYAKMLIWINYQIASKSKTLVLSPLPMATTCPKSSGLL